VGIVEMTLGELLAELDRLDPELTMFVDASPAV
jgi:hypothetical protein